MYRKSVSIVMIVLALGIVTRFGHTQDRGLRISYEWVGHSLNTNLVAVIIDTSILSPKVVGVTSNSPAGHSITGALRSEQAEVVVASGFVERFFPPTPVGLLVIDRATINPLNPEGLSTIIVVRGRALHLISRDSYTSNGVIGAFQVGPRLVQAGEVKILPDEPNQRKPATRSFVGIREDGKVVVGLTVGRVHLYHLAKYLATTVDDGGLGCIDAVNLAGGGSEGLAVDSMGIQTYGNATLRQASMIAFVRSID